MITLHIEANTVEEVRRLAIAALGIDGLKLPRPFAPVSEATAIADAETAIAKRPVGRPRKAPEPQPEPDEVVVSVPGLDPEPFGGYPSFVEDRTEPIHDKPDAVNGEAKDNAIALEKLKQETVAKLPDMFAAGKVNLMRAVLTKYGKGAKSFPEIEAKDFPEIAAALARGDGS